MRAEVVGTVIKAIGQHKWEVLFDYNNKTKTVISKLLKVVDNDIGIPLHKQTELQEVSYYCFNLIFVSILTVDCCFYFILQNRLAIHEFISLLLLIWKIHF